MSTMDLIFLSYPRSGQLNIAMSNPPIGSKILEARKSALSRKLRQSPFEVKHEPYQITSVYCDSNS